MSKSQQRFWSEKHNVSTKEFNKIVLSANDAQRIRSIDSIEIYAYGMSKHLVYRKEKIKCNSIMKHNKNDYLWLSYKIKMIQNWLLIFYHPYRISTTGGSWSG